MAYAKVIENFIRYVKIDTQSLERFSDKVPSTDKQRDLAILLRNELLEMGASNVRYDEVHGYVYAQIPSNLTGKAKAPAIGFIAHMDTSEVVSGASVSPRIIENYDGNDIVLNAELNIVTRVSEFPMLAGCKGKSLIVTDGNTLLGGDDKAGVAEIMAMAEYFLKNPDVKHGKICIGFTPDEEVGNGVEYFDIEGFGADYAYTVDGGELGDMNYECFNAAGATLTVKGKSVHPGYAKNIMKNAIKLGLEFIEALPDERPENTEGYEGFYHVDRIDADVEKATLEFIIRDHDSVKFEERKKIFARTAEALNEKYGEGLFEVEIKDQYRNMREMIEKELFIVDGAAEAMRRAGVEPKISPIRGGTDGARLSFDGLLCPNLCTGSEGHHGRNEFACIEDMETIVERLKNIVLLAHSSFDA
ncbi:MAG: peptidase T [Lachnospiraceae bacterium]|nr:peptidase T [Lachnospiraceae bacterium]